MTYRVTFDLKDYSVIVPDAFTIYITTPKEIIIRLADPEAVDDVPPAPTSFEAKKRFIEWLRRHKNFIERVEVNSIEFKAKEVKTEKEKGRRRRIAIWDDEEFEKIISLIEA